MLPAGFGRPRAARGSAQVGGVTIRVTVQLHTILRLETPDGPVGLLELELPPASTVQYIREALEIELSDEALLLAVNGRVVDVDHPLADGDTVDLMPAISGGDRRCTRAWTIAGLHIFHFLGWLWFFTG